MFGVTFITNHDFHSCTKSKTPCNDRIKNDFLNVLKYVQQVGSNKNLASYNLSKARLLLQTQMKDSDH